MVATNGERVLLGHATRSPRWDIPKGLAEPGEAFRVAAARELKEETGLVVPPECLTAGGIHRYLPGKDLALFVLHLAALPDVAGLCCTSVFTTAGGTVLPEFDRFGLFTWADALTRVGRNMARVLTEIRDSACKLGDAAPHLPAR